MNKSRQNRCKRALLISVSVLICFLGGCGRKFDAVHYTQAVLDWNFQGNIDGIRRYEKDATKEELMQGYQTAVAGFTQAVIGSEFPMDGYKEEEFKELVSKIFTTMRYEVIKAEKKGKNYEVRVEIQPSDVMIRFKNALTTDSLKLAEETAQGKYTGTEEEIQEQLLRDIANRSYELLAVSFEHQEFLEKKEIRLTVERKKDGSYQMDAEDFDRLINKILCLDEIQG